MRLIDADILDCKITEMAREPMYQHEGEDWLTGLCMAMEAVNEAPTVNVTEVTHSQWDTVCYERNGTLATYSHICPKCKYFYRDLRFKGHNYCPNCGARMDGEL